MVLGPGNMWSTSIFACCDSCTCCCACVVPCVVLGQNVHYMNQIGISPIPVIDDCECQGCSKPCLAGSLYFGGMAFGFVGGVLSPYNMYFGNLGWVECGSACLHANIRGAIYKDIAFQSNDVHAADDCCLHFCCALCCYSCALAQEQRELLMLVHPTNTTITNSMLLDDPTTSSIVETRI